MLNIQIVLSKPVKVTLADNDRAHKMVVVLTIQIKRFKHNSGNTGDQGDNLSGYNQNDSNQNTVRSLPNTGYSNSESSLFLNDFTIEWYRIIKKKEKWLLID